MKADVIVRLVPFAVSALAFALNLTLSSSSCPFHRLPQVLRESRYVLRDELRMATAMTTTTTTTAAPAYEMMARQDPKPAVERPGMSDEITSERAIVENKDGKTRLEAF